MVLPQEHFQADRHLHFNLIHWVGSVISRLATILDETRRFKTFQDEKGRMKNPQQTLKQKSNPKRNPHKAIGGIDCSEH